MQHLRKGRKFGRERRIRRALMKSLASSFFTLGKIKTTEAKARELKIFAEPFVTRGKNPTLANARYLRSVFSDAVAKKIMAHAKNMEKRSGGYARITKLGQRPSDGAKMAIIELVR